jgi:hypothetical protein
MSFVGLFMILYSAVVFTSKTQFPGFNALLPCLGTALLLRSEESFLSQVLKIKGLVFIGLLSYSIYLVHWPVIIFFKSFFSVYSFNLVHSLLVILISIALSLPLYYFIEKKFRASNDRLNLIIFLCASLLFLFGFSIAVIKSDGLTSRFWVKNYFSSSEIRRGKEKRFLEIQNKCSKAGWDKCNDLVSGKVNALIVGDSFAPDALNAFSQIYPKTNFMLSSQGGCGPHQNIEQINTPNVGKDKIEECRLLNKQRYDISYLKKFDYIIINVFFRYYTSENLIEYLNFLKSNGINNVIIFGGFYSLKFSDPDILAKYKSEIWETSKLGTIVLY